MKSSANRHIILNHGTEAKLSCELVKPNKTNYSHQTMTKVACKLRVIGVVQGIDFRPYIYRLARQYQLVSWVLNDGAGELIYAEGYPDQLQAFKRATEKNKSVLVRIQGIRLLQQADVAGCLPLKR